MLRGNYPALARAQNMFLPHLIGEDEKQEAKGRSKLLGERQTATVHPTNHLTN
jgi:hypothetical protein